MATKEKWINLFEKAVGRPPHVLEIEEGQKAAFKSKSAFWPSSISKT